MSDETTTGGLDRRWSVAIVCAVVAVAAVGLFVSTEAPFDEPMVAGDESDPSASSEAAEEGDDPVGDSADLGASGWGFEPPDEGPRVIPPAQLVDLPDDAQAERAVDAGGERHLEVYRTAGEPEELCDPEDDLIFRLISGDDVLDEEVLTANCEGACSEEEQRRGEERLRRHEDEGAKVIGNYTGCFALGHRIERSVGGFDRPVFFVASDALGAEDILTTRARLVTVGCNEVAITKPFDNPRWPVTHPGGHFADMHFESVDSEPDGVDLLLHMRSKFDYDGETTPIKPLLRATFDDEHCRWGIEAVD